MSEGLRIQEHKLLSTVCTFGIGGPARYFIEVRSPEDAMKAVKFAREKHLPYLAIGKGSNCLFDDKGANGVIIYNKIDFIRQTSDGVFHVGAGYSFSLLGSQTARQGWAGLEFASGIPGSVGGAVYMNAGANGAEASDTLISVKFLEDGKTIQTLARDSLSFSYRTSPFQKWTGIILGASFQLAPSDEARRKQLEIIAYRTKTQPYGDKSAGCIFRNPLCSHAGALIEQCGLKGFRQGDAEVSAIHGNFIINKGGASANDVLSLIRLIQKEILSKTNIHLESEVRYIPYDLETT